MGSCTPGCVAQGAGLGGCLKGTKCRPDMSGSNTLWAGGRATYVPSPFWLKSVFILTWFSFAFQGRLGRRVS